MTGFRAGVLRERPEEMLFRWWHLAEQVYKTRDGSQGIWASNDIHGLLLKQPAFEPFCHAAYDPEDWLVLSRRAAAHQS